MGVEPEQGLVDGVSQGTSVSWLHPKGGCPGLEAVPGPLSLQVRGALLPQETS